MMFAVERPIVPMLLLDCRGSTTSATDELDSAQLRHSVPTYSGDWSAERTLKTQEILCLYDDDERRDGSKLVTARRTAAVRPVVGKRGRRKGEPTSGDSLEDLR